MVPPFSRSLPFRSTHSAPGSVLQCRLLQHSSVCTRNVELYKVVVMELALCLLSAVRACMHVAKSAWCVQMGCRWGAGGVAKSAWCVQVMLAPGTSVKKAAGAVRQALQKDALRQQGYTWIDIEQYEHEVNVLQRFLVDTSVSGGGLPIYLEECCKPKISTSVVLVKCLQRAMCKCDSCQR